MPSSPYDKFNIIRWALLSVILLVGVSVLTFAVKARRETTVQVNCETQITWLQKQKEIVHTSLLNLGTQEKDAPKYVELASKETNLFSEYTTWKDALSASTRRASNYARLTIQLASFQTIFVILLLILNRRDQQIPFAG